MGGFDTYPKAPVPVVMISTRLAEVVEKSSRIFCRELREQSPSILAKTIFSSFKYFSTRFKVFVQHEKMILESVTKDPVRDAEISIPFCELQILFDISNQRNHLGRFTFRF